MKPSTVRTLLALCVVLDVVLLGLVLYDYFVNESAWIAFVLVAFALFVVATAILFLLAGRANADGERVVVREVHHESTQDFQSVSGISPPIPLAPVRSTVYVAPVPPAKPAYILKTVTEPRTEGPFVFNGYRLHSRAVELANAGGTRTIYFFSKKKPKSGKPCAKPAGYHVGVNERTGLPFLKKGAGKDGEDLTPEAAEKGYRPQCSALTEEGQQCRNSAREGSKYCAPHFGYQPPALAKATVERKDTKARVKDAPDTLPSTRKSWFGRGRTNV